MKLSALVWLLTLVFISFTAYAQPLGVRYFKERMKAPAFSLPDTDNRTHNLADYKGQVLILNFWATWCVPCVKEMPTLKKAWHRLHQEGVQLLGVATRESRETVTAFKREHNVGFPLPIDRDGNVANSWTVMAVPTAYVVDTNGRIAMRIVGGNDWNSSALLDAIIALKQDNLPNVRLHQ